MTSKFANYLWVKVKFEKCLYCVSSDTMIGSVGKVKNFAEFREDILNLVLTEDPLTVIEMSNFQIPNIKG